MSSPTLGAKLKLEGEKEFRKALTNINAEARVTSSEFKKVTAVYAANANSIEALTAKDKTLNQQVSVQEEKVRKLKEALAFSQKEYGENDTKTSKWKTSLNLAEAELAKLNNDVEKNAQELNKAKTSTSTASSGMDKFGRSVSSAKKETSTFKEVLKANLGTAAIIGGVKALGSTIKSVGSQMLSCASSTTKYADDITVLSAQTGISTKKLQQYNYMAELTDVSVESITGSMKKNIKSMSNAASGSKKYADAYRQLGVDVVGTDGHLKNSETVYWQCIDALGKMKNSTERDSLAMQLFGKSAQDLNPMIKKGSGAMKSLADEADRMGAVMGDDALNALCEADDATQRMTQATEILKRKIGVQLAPVVEDISKKFTSFVEKNGDKIGVFVNTSIKKLGNGLAWCKDHIDEIKVAAVSLVALIGTVKTVQFLANTIESFKTLKSAIDAAKVSQIGLNIAESATPIGLIVTAVAAAGIGIYALAKACKQEKNDMDTMNESINKTRQSLQSMKQQQQEQLQGNLAEIANTKSLKKELDTLVDANGKIKKGYESRAQFIVGQLSEASGTEIQIVNGQIEKYKQLSNQIDKLIQKKRAQIILDSQEAPYKEAIKNQTKVLSEKQKSENAYYAAKQKITPKIAQIEKRYADEEKQLISQYKSGLWSKEILEQQILRAKQGRNDEIEELYKNDPEGKYFKSSQRAWESAKKSVKENTSAITTYETNAARLTSGKSSEIDKVNKSTAESYKVNGKDIKVTLNQQLQNAKTYYQSLLDGARSGDKSITNEQITAAKNRVNELNKQIAAGGAKNKGAFKSAGKVAASGFKQGLSEELKGVVTSSFKLVISQIPGIGSQVKQAMQSVLGVPSPTKKSKKKATTASLQSLNNMPEIPSTLQQVNQVQLQPETNIDLSGDLKIQCVLDGNVVFESVYKEFKKRKISDPTYSMA